MKKAQAVPFWWEKLLADPSFTQAVSQRWKEYRAASFSDKNIDNAIDSLCATLTACGAEARNEEAWKIYGRRIWPSYTTITDHAEEIGKLKAWIKRRVAFLDKSLLSTTATEACRDINADKPAAVSRHTPDGRRANNMTKGLVITRYSDGSAKKTVLH